MSLQGISEFINAYGVGRERIDNLEKEFQEMVRKLRNIADELGKIKEDPNR